MSHVIGCQGQSLDPENIQRPRTVVPQVAFGLSQAAPESTQRSGKPPALTESGESREIQKSQRNTKESSGIKEG